MELELRRMCSYICRLRSTGTVSAGTGSAGGASTQSNVGWRLWWVWMCAFVFRTTTVLFSASKAARNDGSFWRLLALVYQHQCDQSDERIGAGLRRVCSYGYRLTSTGTGFTGTDSTSGASAQANFSWRLSCG